jgi:hypothetical protein
VQLQIIIEFDIEFGICAAALVLIVPFQTVAAAAAILPFLLSVQFPQHLEKYAASTVTRTARTTETRPTRTTRPIPWIAILINIERLEL